jgi:glycosyltransferase involved in cell wall biosynthesis
VPKAALLIAGGWHTETDTPYIMTLKQKSLEVLPSRCQWVGYIPDERLSAAYGAMDVVVYPSRYATESGALIMALGYGKAVLASNIEPFKEKEKVGALMTFKGVRDLTRKIKRLLKDEELRRQLEEGAKKYCEETSWNKIAEKHIALYKQLLSL